MTGRAGGVQENAAGRIGVKERRFLHNENGTRHWKWSGSCISESRIIVHPVLGIVQYREKRSIQTGPLPLPRKEVVGRSGITIGGTECSLAAFSAWRGGEDVEAP